MRVVRWRSAGLALEIRSNLDPIFGVGDFFIVPLLYLYGTVESHLHYSSTHSTVSPRLALSYPISPTMLYLPVLPARPAASPSSFVFSAFFTLHTLPCPASALSRSRISAFLLAMHSPIRPAHSPIFQPTAVPPNLPASASIDLPYHLPLLVPCSSSTTLATRQGNARTARAITTHASGLLLYSTTLTRPQARQERGSFGEQETHPIAPLHCISSHTTTHQTPLRRNPSSSDDHYLFPPLPPVHPAL